jgi:phosphoesterase RecJ-like protein
MTEIEQIVGLVRVGRRFVVSSHQRPDGDAIGSAFAMALALEAIGKHAEVVMDQAPPHYLQPFPAVDRLRVTRRIEDAFDGALIMECSALDRTGVAGLDRSPLINVDHHPGNTHYGALNWVDESAAACGELVFLLIQALGAPLTPDIATHVYLAVLTDTGSFHFSGITARSFDIAGRCVAAGADPQWIARTYYDSCALARVRLLGSALSGMRLDASGRVAVMTMTREDAAAAGATYDDTDGIVNVPLSVKAIEAVAFFKETEPRTWRVSMRSKGDVDVGVVARAFDGGGHRNAAGCSVSGDLAPLQEMFLRLLVERTNDAARAGRGAGPTRS